MTAFRRQMQLALVAGASAGFVLFLSQWVLVKPLIRRAEAYERIDPVRAASHADESCEPGEGLERVACTQALFWLVQGAVGRWMHTRALEKHGANLERPS
jgi:predicted cobalt transporter CbtA